MAELKGSKTEQNLWSAFAGESQARNKYTYFASKAKKDGYVQISKIFEETAANEKEHAEIWFKLLNGIGTTAENLEAAAQMAAEGLGVAFNFLGYIQYFSYEKPISYFLTGDPNVFIDYYLIRRKDAYLAPQVADFIQILHKLIAQHAFLTLPQHNEGASF